MKNTEAGTENEKKEKIECAHNVLAVIHGLNLKKKDAEEVRHS